MQLGIQREESTQRESPVCTICFFQVAGSLQRSTLIICIKHPTQEVNAFLTILSNNVATSPRQANK